MKIKPAGIGRKPKKAETKQKPKKAKSATPYVDNTIVSEVEELGGGHYYVQTPETFFFLSKRTTGGDIPEAGREIVIFNSAHAVDGKTSQIVAVEFNGVLHVVGDIDALDDETLRALNSKIIETRSLDAIVQMPDSAISYAAGRAATDTARQR
ncbi:MAG: hypothetical protein LBI17_02455 [Rickettsiales bacterium]|jgi:hypothetical protein|nr:hypothetical protein [Rickettsiales bacterium]